MLNKLKYILFLLVCISVQTAFAQVNGRNGGYQGQGQGQQQPSYMRDTARTSTRKMTDDQLIDTLRKQEENRQDSVIFTSKFINVTNESLLRDSTQVFPLDTTLSNFENYSPLYQPRSPRIGLGNLGLAQRSLLFEPVKTIGFDVGLHSLDVYLLQPQDIQYYKARVPYTQLSLVTAGLKEQVFKVLHTQNIKPNWNIGFNLNFIGSKGFYGSDIIRQNVSDFSAAAFTWYESKNKRYNLLANITFNNLKAPETGSILKDDIFTGNSASLSKSGENVRLPNTYENWKNNGFYIKQFYYIGRIDSLKKGADSSKVLPTQRVAYTFNYNKQVFHFQQNDEDVYKVFPEYYFGSNRSRDSTSVLHYQNDFSYSFYLRSKAVKLAKNEIKLDIGLTQDLYHYTQYVSDTTINDFGYKVTQKDKVQSVTFQNITLKGRIGYRFSDRILLEGDVRQIAQGRNFGDFIYEAKLILAGGSKAGKIVLDAYSQSSSPPLVYTDWVSNHYIFHNSFKNQKTTSLSFNYINTPLQVDLKAEYFLISDYLYFTAQPGGIDAHPAQLGAAVNLLKISLGKNLTFRRWHFDNFIVYQKTDFQSTLRTPEVYTYSNLYYTQRFFEVLHTNIGINVRYNTQYVAPSYAVGLGQFYNGSNVTFSSYPVASIYLKATLYKTNLFLQYDYANQGLFSQGFYTVNRYPMQDKVLKIGVAWSFYN